MSHKVISFLVYCFFFLIVFISCAKKENPMPVKIISNGVPIAADGKIRIENRENDISVEFSGKAVFENGGITITNTATKNNIYITLRTNAQTKGGYTLGSSYSSLAEYEIGNYIYTTNYYNSSGKITITEVDQVKKTVSGTYSFRANDGSYYEDVYGSFNKLPYTVSVFTNTLTATVAEGSGVGVSWSPTSIVATADASFINIKASKSDNSGIELKILKTISPGYNILGTSSSYNNTAYYIRKNGLKYNVYSNYGSVNISTHDKTKRMISGTFYFETEYSTYYTGYNKISNGTFSVMY